MRLYSWDRPGIDEGLCKDMFPIGKDFLLHFLHANKLSSFQQVQPVLLRQAFRSRGPFPGFYCNAPAFLSVSKAAFGHADPGQTRNAMMRKNGGLHFPCTLGSAPGSGACSAGTSS